MKLIVCMAWLLTGIAGVAVAGPTTQPYLLHLPGIGGHLRIDDALLEGLRDGGVPGLLELRDWTGSDRGLIALMQSKRHDEQATIVAKLLTEKLQRYPDIHITITSHSAGCGIAAWALEKLPDGVMIDNWVQMQSALSPGYDLSGALRHVRRAYVFKSALDAVVLGIGTRTAGTVDGVQSDAAGRVGYQMPATADADQYVKLKEFEFEERWMQLDDIGDHIGPMTYRFARFMIAPLLISGELPDPQRIISATTRAVAPASRKAPLPPSR